MANVTVISATVPLLAARLAWLILRERVRRSTVMATAVAIAGVTPTVAGNLGPGDLDANLRAVVLAFLLALLIVLLRRFEGADTVPALCSARVLALVAALVVADPLGVAADQFRLIVFFGLVFACHPRGHPVADARCSRATTTGHGDAIGRYKRRASREGPGCWGRCREPGRGLRSAGVAGGGSVVGLAVSAFGAFWGSVGMRSVCAEGAFGCRLAVERGGSERGWPGAFRGVRSLWAFGGGLGATRLH